MFFLLITVLLAALAEGWTYPSVTHGGTCQNTPLFSCPCGDVTAPNGVLQSLSAELRFHSSFDPLLPSSFFQESSSSTSLSVALGRPLPPVSIRFVPSNTSSLGTCASSLPWVSPSYGPLRYFPKSIAEFDSSVNITAASIYFYPPDLGFSLSFEGNVAFARNGEITLYGLNITGPKQTDFYLRIETNVGLWILSPMLALYANLTGFDITMRLVEDGENVVSSLSCFAFPYITAGIALPRPVKIQLLDTSGFLSSRFERQLVTVGASYEAPVDASVVLSVTTSGFGNITNGTATLPDITLVIKSQGDAVASAVNLYFTNVRFSFSVASGVSPLYTPWMKLIPSPLLAFSIMFGQDSFLRGISADPLFGSNSTYRPLVVATIGVAMRRIVVDVVDSSGRRDTSANDFFVTASAAGAQLSSSAAQVAGGVAVFESLIFSSVENVKLLGAKRNLVLTFAASGGRLGFPRRLLSQYVEVSADNVNRASGMLRLRPFGNDLIGNTDGSYFAPADRELGDVVVEVLGRDGLLNPTASCRMVALSTLLQRNYTADVVTGVAIFTNMRFTGAVGTVATILFSCVVGNIDGPYYNVSSVGLSLTVSPITLVTSPTDTTIRFEPSAMSLFSAQFQPSFATSGVTLPPIVVEVTNTFGELDLSLDEVAVKLVASVNVSGRTSVFTKRGRAVFSSVVLYCATAQASCSARLQFRASTTSVLPTTSPVKQLTLVTGLISVASARSRQFGLKFLPGSFISYHGERVSVAFGFALPPIGLGIFNSDHSPSVGASSLVVVASITSGQLDGTLKASVDANGVAWFQNLVLNSTVALVEPRLVFCVAAASSYLSASAPVMKKCVASGELLFQYSSSPCWATLAPTLTPSGEPLLAGNNTITVQDPSGPTSNLTRVLINATNETLYFRADTSFFSLRTIIVNGGNRVSLPKLLNLTKVTAQVSWSAALRTSSFGVDTRPQVYPARTYAEFSTELQYSSALLDTTPFVRGATHSITLTSPWLPSRPLRIGTVLMIAQYESSMVTTTTGLGDKVTVQRTLVSRSFAPVIVLELSWSIEFFVLEDWIARFCSVLQIPHDQVECLLVRECGALSSGSVPYWSGTHIELRLLQPTTASLSATPASDLAARIVRWTPSCSQGELGILYKYQKDAPPPFCDAFRLEEQSIAAQRCFSFSQDLCGCYGNLFGLLGSVCGGSDVVATLCSKLSRCSNANITGGCATYNSNMAKKYILIAVYVLLFVLLVALFWLYRSKWFDRLCAETLGKRNRRDIEYEGLKITREKGEKISSDDIL